MKPGERNKFVDQLRTLRGRMCEPGFTVMTRDVEMLAELIVALEIKAPRARRVKPS